MNIPISWIKEYVDLNCDVNEFSHAMTMSGSKVEAVEYLGSEIKNVVVGKILSIDKHPGADKLVITKVDVGEREIQIVTGATNLNVGDYVPVALDGATLHGGLKIKKGKLRGEESNGMLCSIEELGYTRHDYPEAPEYGIYVFPEPQDLGSDAVPLMQLCDEVVEFEITTNRPDCNSVVGLAREAAATFSKELKYPDTSVKEAAGEAADKYISVEIENSKNCLRYAARVVKNVKIGPSPLWMRHRLTASNVRPINNIVDITNYVMLELGQPMHAFDIDNIAQRKIIVRDARDGEVFTTLDGAERVLDSSMLVIADAEKAVAVGGVMGGENSKVTESATAILLESANFYGPNIRQTSKKLGLRTDASSKYEKGLDPNLCDIAVNRAAHLIELLGAGEIVSGIVDNYPTKRYPVEVKYNVDSINARFGTNISEEDMEKYLNSVEIKASNGVAKAPTFRADIEIEADIAEEIARLYGYDKIETTLAAGTPTVGKKSLSQNVSEVIKEVMVSQGYCEAMNYSFESPKTYDKLLFGKDDSVRNAVKIINPLGEDFSVMRSVSLGGMLQSLSTNFNRRNEEASLFEMSKIYIPKSVPMTELPDEPVILTLGFYGNKDFFDLKGTLEYLFEKLNIKNVSYTRQNKINHMHPGRCADVVIGEKCAGYFGEIHPKVCANYQIGARVLVAVLDIQTLIDSTVLERLYKPLAKFPAVKRDIAVLVTEDVPVGDIEAAIRERAGKILEDVVLFDVYQGEQIEKGFKSVAYNLFLRSADKTLTEEEASSCMEKILKNLETKVGAKLR